VALAASPAAAGVQGRLDAQEDRIIDGLAEGTLTEGEARRLRREQNRIRRVAGRRSALDGSLSWRSQIRLERMQDAAARHIGRAEKNRRATREAPVSEKKAGFVSLF